MNMNKNNYPTITFRAFVLILAFAFSANIFAAPAKKTDSLEGFSDFYLSLGNLCEFIGTYQTNDEGKKNGCTFLPSLAASVDSYLTNDLIFMPQIGFTIPKSGLDEKVKRMTIFALINMKFKTNYINLIGGAGFYVTRIWGPGGDLELNNGNSTDSFPLPNDAVYSRNLIINLGLGLDFNKQWSGELYTYVFNAFESLERAYSLGLTVSYHFGEVL